MGKNKLRRKTILNLIEDIHFKDGLANYSPAAVLTRVMFNCIVGFLMLHFVIYFSGLENAYEQVTFFDYAVICFSLTLLSESLIVVDRALEFFFPIPIRIRLRSFLQSVLGLMCIAGLFFITIRVIDYREDIPKSVRALGLVFGYTFAAIFSSGLLIMRMTQKWIKYQKEMDIIKQEKLKMDFNSLQDQINPHFLFNNLSVLKSLIIYDQETAVKFTENFTDVYRYVLQSKDKVVVSLIDELEFIDAYLGLHKERLGEGLKVKLSIDKDTLQKEVAPLTLQLLVENAIKHNIVSKDQPLSIEIIAKDNYLGVINTLQLKEASYSTKTGLNNLMQRYKMLTEEEVKVVKSNSEFMVQVPLV